MSKEYYTLRLIQAAAYTLLEWQRKQSYYPHTGNV